jgi:hypothetical protein
MANNHISVDQQKRLGNLLRRASDITRESLTVLTQIRDVMDEMNDGIDYTTLEQAFGLQTGKGLLAYNLVNGARAAVQSPATINFINRVG